MSDKTDDEKEAEEQKKRNLLLEMLEWLWDNLGSILLFGLLLVGAAYFIGPEKLGQWFGKDNVDGAMNGLGDLWDNLKLKFAELTGRDVSPDIAAMSDDELQKMLEKKLESKDAAKIIVANRAPFFDTIKHANGEQIQINDFTNANSIFALMTKQPGVVLALLKTMPTGGTAGGAMGQQIQAALKTIVSDSTKLGTLLSMPYRTNTIAMLLAMKPELQTLDLQSIIAHGSDAKGNVSPELQALITAVLSGDDAAIAKAQAAFLSKIGPVAALHMVSAAAISSDPAVQQIIRELQTPAASQALNALTAKLDKIAPGQTAALMTALMPSAPEAGKSSPNATSIVLSAALHNPGALPQFVALADQLPSVKAAMPLDLHALQEVVQTGGIRNGAFTPQMQPLLTAIQSNDPFGQPTIAALTNLVTSPQMLASPQAQAAALTLVASIKPESVPEAQRDQFVKLQTFLGQSGKEAFAFLATQDPAQAATMLNKLVQNPSAATAFEVGTALIASDGVRNNTDAQQKLAALVTSLNAASIGIATPQAQAGLSAAQALLQPAQVADTFAVLKAIPKEKVAPLLAAVRAYDPAKPESLSTLLQLGLQRDTIGALPGVVALLEKIPQPTRIASTEPMAPALLQLPPIVTTFATLVKTIGLNGDGKPNAALSALLSHVPSGPCTTEQLSAALLPAIPAFLTAPDVFGKVTTPGPARDAVLGFIDAIDPAKLPLTAAQQRSFMQMKTMLQQHSAQVFDALGALGPTQSKEAMDMLLSGKASDDVLHLALRPENINALPQMLALVKALPAEMLPIPPAQLQNLLTLVEQTGMKDGKPIDALKALLTQIPATGPLTADMLTTPPMVDALTQFALDPEVFAKITTPGAAQNALLALVAATDAKGTDSQREALATFKALTGPANAPQTLKLLNALGPDGAKKLLAAIKSGNEEAMMKVVFKYSGAFKLFADTVNLEALAALPAKLQERLKKPLMQLRNKTAEQISALATIDERVGLTTLEKDFMQTDSSGALKHDAKDDPILDKDKLAGCAFDAKCRDDVKRAGIGHIAVVLANQDLKLGDTATIAQNLTALTAFGDALDANPANATAAGKSRVDTIRAALKTLVMTGSTDSLKNIPADDINAFFGDHANADAFRHLMYDVDPAALSALGDAGKAGADLVRALQATYKNGKTGADELLAILADHESMAAIKKADEGPSWAPQWLVNLATPYLAPTVITENPDILPIIKVIAKNAATVARN